MFLLAFSLSGPVLKPCAKLSWNTKRIFSDVSHIPFGPNSERSRLNHLNQNFNLFKLFCVALPVSHKQCLAFFAKSTFFLLLFLPLCACVGFCRLVWTCMFPHREAYTAHQWCRGMAHIHQFLQKTLLWNSCLFCWGFLNTILLFQPFGYNLCQVLSLSSIIILVDETAVW